MSINLDALKAPFAPSKISWRIGSTNADKSKGMALAYIDARDVQDRLDDVCGADGWQCRYVPMHDKKTVCEIGIRHFVHGSPELDDRGAWKNPTAFEWIWKSDGAGDSDVEAEKGALSDAFKRAAVKWGIGRYLYDIPSPWVAITAAGRSFKIADHEYTRLEGLLAKDAPKPSVTQPKQPGGDVYAPEHVKVPQKPPASDADRAANAKAWALGEIPRIKAMDRAALDKFCDRFKATREELAKLDSKTSVELEKALSDRLEALFA